MTAKNKPTYSDDLPTRVAVLERDNVHFEKALTTLTKAIEKLDTDMKAAFEKLDNKIESKFWWLLTFVLGTSASILGIVAKGFHWF